MDVQGKDRSNIRVVINLCAWDTLKPQTNLDIIRLITSGLIYGYEQCEGALLPMCRNVTIFDTYKNLSDFTHILFLDADMSNVTKEVIEGLIDADKDIISPMTCIRKPPFQPHLRPNDFPKLIEQLGRDIPDRELIEVEGVATACMLVKRAVLEKTVEYSEDRKHVMWFMNDREPRSGFQDELEAKLAELKTGQYADEMDMLEKSFIAGLSLGRSAHLGTPYVGEDFNFCQRAKAEGFKVWLHTKLTVGHIGEQNYDIRDWFRINQHPDSQMMINNGRISIWRKDETPDVKRIIQ